MIKTKAAQKGKGRAFLFLSLAGLFSLMVGLVFAQQVPQNIGFMDVKFSTLDRGVCEGCHGESLVDTHHSTEPATSGNCVLCHSVSTLPGSTGVSLNRDCMTCHEQSPHHVTEDAKNKKCILCHDDFGISAYSTEAPPYKPSKVTPTSGSCRNCHGEGTVDGRPVVGAQQTHHGTSIKECNVCHDQLNLSTDQDVKSEKGTSIRVCERCHNVKALHEVAPHIEKASCALCHGGKKSAPKQEEEPQ